MRQWSLADRETPAKGHFKISLLLAAVNYQSIVQYILSLLFKVLFSNLKRILMYDSYVMYDSWTSLFYTKELLKLPR